LNIPLPAGAAANGSALGSIIFTSLVTASKYQTVLEDSGRQNTYLEKPTVYAGVSRNTNSS
jgi:hypothetical protein